MQTRFQRLNGTLSRALAVCVVGLLLLQHVPLTTPDARCCTPQQCHCPEKTCTCPGCDQHDGAERASDGPTFRACGPGSSAMPLPTLTLSKGLIGDANSFLAPLPRENVSAPPELRSSQVAGSDIFRPPRARIG